MPYIHVTRVVAMFPEYSANNRELRDLTRCKGLPLSSYFHPYWRRCRNEWLGMTHLQRWDQNDEVDADGMIGEPENAAREEAEEER